MTYSIIANVNTTLKELQETIISSVNTMISTQLDTINQKMIVTIQAALTNPSINPQQKIHINSSQLMSLRGLQTNIISQSTPL